MASITGSNPTSQLPPNLTQPARYVLEMAREITAAGSATHPEHILYALLQIPGSDVPKTIELMESNDRQLLETVRLGLRGLNEVKSTTAWSNSSAQIIAHASTLAFQQRSKEISTNHLFTAMLSVESTVRSMLLDRGISLSKLQSTQIKPAAPETKTKRKVTTSPMGAIEVSGVFWGLLAATAICGYLAWSPAVPNKPFAVFLFVTLAWIVSLCLHEFGHAFTAYLFGDDSVYERGYLTLNPLRYADPFISIVLPLVFLMLNGLGLPGGAVYIDRSRIKDGWRHSLVALAGPLANALVVAILWIILLLIPHEIKIEHSDFWSGVTFLLFLEITAIFFNLIPLPPLDGFNILSPFLPDSMQGLVYTLRQWGFFILMMLFWIDNPIMDEFWMNVFRIMVRMNIDVGFALHGYDIYRFWMLDK